MTLKRMISAFVASYYSYNTNRPGLPSNEHLQKDVKTKDYNYL